MRRYTNTIPTSEAGTTLPLFFPLSPFPLRSFLYHPFYYQSQLSPRTTQPPSRRILAHYPLNLKTALGLPIPTLTVL